MMFGPAIVYPWIKPFKELLSMESMKLHRVEKRCRMTTNRLSTDNGKLQLLGNLALLAKTQCFVLRPKDFFLAWMMYIALLYAALCIKEATI